jgi:DNA-binding NarL/FixJ family response regulator
MFLEGLRSILEQDANICISAEAKNGNEVISCIKNDKPDIVLLDINMPVMNGIETTTYIRKNYPEIKVIILSMYKTKGFINGLTKSGASAYLLKNTGQKELFAAINTVASGGTYFSREVAEALALSKTETSNAVNPSLSKREVEIIKELAAGLTSKQIAEKLRLSSFTVETHRKNINNKLGFSNSAEVIRFALESGMLE